MIVRRGMTAAVVAALSGILAGCSGDSLSTATLTSPPSGATADKPGFNPFSTEPETASGGREVILNPTVAEVMQQGDLPEMSWGSPNAPVTLIKYMSLTCPHCKRFHAEVYPVLKRDYIDTGKVRFIMREFPIGKSSGTATVALRCASPDKYLDLYGRFMNQQAQWVSQEVRTDAIFRVAAQAGVTQEQFNTCMSNQTLVSQLNAVKERGRKLGVIGTPNFFVNGKLVKSTVGIAELKAMIDPIIAGGATAPVASRTN